jgi:glycosyltransferase involved in cell wall biosynthesis
VNVTPRPPSGPLRAVSVLDDGATCGVCAHVRSLAHGLVERGVEVTVCGPVRVEAEHRFTSSGARFRTVETGASARDEAAALGVLRYVCSSAAVVHAHGPHAGLLSALALAALRLAGRRVPLVLTLHAAAEPHGPRARLRTAVERRVVRRADIVLCASSDLVRHARELGARDARLAPVAAPQAGTLPDAAQLRRKVRAEFGVGERPLLLSLGRLAPGQGFRQLLDAARDWRGADPEPLLVIGGDGPYRDDLQRRVDAEGLPVRLLGRREDVPELLAAADVVVVPSRWEGRSWLAQEALRRGVPLVATAVGGLPELVGDAASLVPYGDPAALARAVTDLVHDPARRAALATRGRTQSSTWPDENDTVAQVLSIYDELATN